MADFPPEFMQQAANAAPGLLAMAGDGPAPYGPFGALPGPYGTVTGPVQTIDVGMIRPGEDQTGLFEQKYLEALHGGPAVPSSWAKEQQGMFERKYLNSIMGTTPDQWSGGGGGPQPSGPGGGGAQPGPGGRRPQYPAVPLAWRELGNHLLRGTQVSREKLLTDIAPPPPNPESTGPYGFVRAFGRPEGTAFWPAGSIGAAAGGSLGYPGQLDPKVFLNANTG